MMLRNTVHVIDYGMGNLASVRRSFEECGAQVTLVSRPQDLVEATKIVLPGVGSFQDGMKNLREAGWVDVVRDLALNKRIPLLGICLGMQLLADEGEEGGASKGLGLIPGKVVHLKGLLQQHQVDPSETRIPHVGWNEVRQAKAHWVCDGISDRSDFYFTHSFYFQASDPEAVFGETEHGASFPSVVGLDQVVGVQFHPEKSSKAGFKMIRNFLKR